MANEAVAVDVQSEARVKDEVTCPAFLKHNLRKLNSSKSVDICEQYAGKTFLIVNTASHCGYTPQFKGLEALHKKYQKQGLVVLGFPSDDFFQEEDEEKDAADICFVNYGVTFDVFATSAVRGSDVNPVFAYLNEQTASPYWNFYKYLVSADGSRIQRFSSKVEPQSAELTSAIEKQLAKSSGAVNVEEKSTVKGAE
ncbi:glutathione peroxidase [Thalassotalea crassostreae]|uniref:glutathione peroxidase n=1 Tax=Thalassotalea crassostreae TaxID=1763536 RepID=UPI000838A3F0|nr:glutathione peroxidase [Thalassotalea crassostreae]